MKRDFTESSRQRLIGMVNQVESEKFSDFTDWIGDRWYDFESWIGKLNIKNYLDDVNRYHKKVLDKNNATVASINQIFEAVNMVDASFATKIREIVDQANQEKLYLVELSETIRPETDKFGGGDMDNLMHVAEDFQKTCDSFGQANPIIKDKQSLWGKGITGAVVSGAIAGQTEVGNINVGGKLSGDVVGGKVSIKGSAKWDTEKGDAKAEIKAEAKGHVISGKAEGNVGCIYGSIKGDVGNAAVSGAVGASLFKDGRFAPKIQAKAEAEVNLASGEVKSHLGTEDNNIHAKASGDVLKAKAEASAGAGKISVKNSKGEEKTAIGVEAKAGAEAYAATGKISGGFTLFGIKVDASAEGKAGGAGASAGVSISTAGVSGSIGAGLGIGAGLSISIDWSEFSLFRKK